MKRAAGAEYDFSPLKVLVVEDSKNMQKLLHTILSALGVRQIQCVFTGKETMEELSRFEADLVI